MDWTHLVLIVASILALGIPIVGFVALARILRKDEAIDAATFLALRSLEEYVQSGKPGPGTSR